MALARVALALVALARVALALVALALVALALVARSHTLFHEPQVDLWLMKQGVAAGR